MKRLFIFLWVIAAPFALAHPILRNHFADTFKSHYTEGRCGDNILGFLDRVDRLGVNLSGAEILEITNEGFSVFGMVNAEFARNDFRNPIERNWFHHVVLEHEGLIYDFDFGNSPRVLKAQQYFEEMFLTEVHTQESGRFYVGREEKLKTYQVLTRPAFETLRARQNRQASPLKEKLRLGEYLKKF